MINRYGLAVESNPLIRYIFMMQGVEGLIIGKMWFTIILLIAAYYVQLTSREQMYWTVNGFLLALTAGGLMAMGANLSAISGEAYASPVIIIAAYLFLVFIFTEIGSLLDRCSGSPS
jgi:hypothetical protein